MKKYFLILVLNGIYGVCASQDFLFGNPNVNKTLFNPAWQTNYDYFVQFSGQHRQPANVSMKEAAYRTTGATLHWTRPLKYVNYWGIGGQFCRDDVENGFYNQTQGSISGFYSQLLAKTDGRKQILMHYLAGGFSGSYHQQRLGSDLRWVTEYDFQGTLQPNFTLPTGFAFTEPPLSQWSANAGVLYYATDGTGNDNEIGVSAFHLNRPNTAWRSDTAIALPIRWNVHLGWCIPVGRSWKPKIQIIYAHQGVYSQTILGLSIPLLPKRGLTLESMYRRSALSNGLKSNALIIGTNIRTSFFELWLNYDRNLGMNLFNQRFQDALEIGFVLRFKK